jgi:LysM repeat protein
MTYTVQESDTLWDIFRRFDISIRDLLAYNDRCDLFEMKKGQTLIIKTRPRKCNGYVLQEDEALSSVARKFGVSISALLKANCDRMPQEIRQGICITLPVSTYQSPSLDRVTT